MITKNNQNRYSLYAVNLLSFIVGAAFASLIIVAQANISWPETPSGGRENGEFKKDFERLLTSCEGTGLALGYSGSTDRISCITIEDLKIQLLSGTTNSIQNKACSISGEFVTGFTQTGELICQPN